MIGQRVKLPDWFKFQSLTGRLKTSIDNANTRDKILFQSLTGRLKTRGRFDLVPAENVSIPHR